MSKFELHEIDDGVPGLIEKTAKVSYESRNIYVQTQFEKNLNYFHIMKHEESHSVRRKMILERHPDIKILLGPDITSLWFGICFVLIQLFSLYFFHQTGWLIFMLSCYIIGGTLSHALHVLIHDLTHFSCFETLALNKFVAIFSNFGQGIPSAITFGRYHADHHTYLNLVGLDPDLPSELELQYIKGPIPKLMFIILMPLFYGLRPLIQRPLIPNCYELLNIVSVLLVDILIYKYIGPYALLWLIMSTFFGLSLHPFAGHLIAEHYEFIYRLETYDYLGWMNFFNLNIGYHIEHHDFPMIPWTRLPLLRQMAPEFYEHLPCHQNYLYTLYHYVFDGYMGPFSRIVRKVDPNQSN